MINQTRWSIDQAHTEISFKVKHLMIANVKGIFKTFDASVYTEAKDFTTAEIDVWIDASSISTGDEMRDGHLKGKEFFDVEKYKQIFFTSKSMTKEDAEGNYELSGELTMKGITKNIILQVQFGGLAKDQNGKEKAGFSITGKLKKSEWGLVTNIPLKTGGSLIGEEIIISCDVEFTNLGKREFANHLESENHAKYSL